MGTPVKDCGGSITLKADPSKAKVGTAPGKLELHCHNGSNLAYTVAVSALSTTSPTVATTQITSPVVPIVATINGRAGAWFPKAVKLDLGAWTAVAAGKCFLVAAATMVGSSGSSRSHQPDEPVVVK